MPSISLLSVLTFQKLSRYYRLNLNKKEGCVVKDKDTVLPRFKVFHPLQRNIYRTNCST